MEQYFTVFEVGSFPSMFFATVFMPPKAGTDMCIILESVQLDALIGSWQSKKERTALLDKYKLE